MIGTGLFMAMILLIANFLIYHSFDRTLSEEVDKQLLQSASMLAKSAELEGHGLVYEWQEAMESQNAPDITGMFEFFDLKSGKTTKSPDLGSEDLPLFHGALNEPVLRDIVLEDGSRARAVGLRHLPFTDEASIATARKNGQVLHPEEFPQVLVCVLETESLSSRLNDLRGLLIKVTLATLVGSWLAIFGIVNWCFRPIREFSEHLIERSKTDNSTVAEIPQNLPSELIPLASAFNTSLDRVEKSREREKEFALHAAHELRTPVAGILATLEQAIIRPRPSDDLVGRIGEALKITSEMRVTLNSLMRLARLRGGLELSTKESTDPITMIREIVNGLAPVLTNRQIDVIQNFPSSAAPLTTDSGLFRVLISNLIDNAVNHTIEKSTVTLIGEDLFDRFIFSTKNPCQNLAEKDLERLFEPFQRGDTHGDAESGHAGLGLSLAKEAARILGGNLEAAIQDGFIVFTVTMMRS